MNNIPRRGACETQGFARKVKATAMKKKDDTLPDIAALPRIKAPSARVHAPAPEEEGFFEDVLIDINDPERLQIWLIYNTNPSLCDAQGKTLLHYTENEECCRLLLFYGADANARAADGTTPLVSGRRTAAMLAMLLAEGADPNARDAEGRPALLRAQDAYSVRLLLAAGADPRAADARGETALFRHGRAGSAKLLLAAGADPLAVTAAGETTLMRAKDAETTALLLAAGVDPNARAADGTTALMNVRSVEQAQLLIDAGADVNARDANGLTPLLRVRRGDCAELFARLGADPLLRGKDGRTALFHGTVHKLRRLLEAGVDVHAAADDGTTAHTAFTRIPHRDVSRELELLRRAEEEGTLEA